MPVLRRDPEDSSVRSSEDACLQASSYCPCHTNNSRDGLSPAAASDPVPQVQVLLQLSSVLWHRAFSNPEEPYHFLRTETSTLLFGAAFKSSHFLWPVLISVTENTIEQEVFIARTYTSSQPVFLPWEQFTQMVAQGDVHTQLTRYLTTTIFVSVHFMNLCFSSKALYDVHCCWAGVPHSLQGQVQCLICVSPNAAEALGTTNSPWLCAIIGWHQSCIGPDPSVSHNMVWNSCHRLTSSLFKQEFKVSCSVQPPQPLQLKPIFKNAMDEQGPKGQSLTPGRSQRLHSLSPCLPGLANRNTVLGDYSTSMGQWITCTGHGHFPRCHLGPVPLLVYLTLTWLSLSLTGWTILTPTSSACNCLWICKSQPQTLCLSGGTESRAKSCIWK